METDFASRKLRDRATQGENLTEDERAQLAAWYAQQDAEEGTLLNPTAPASSATLQALRAEVEDATGRLLTTTKRIHSLTEENEALYRDVAALSQRLARTAGNDYDTRD